jgi:hypothetical protein
MRGNGRILSTQENNIQGKTALSGDRYSLLKQCSDLAESPYILQDLDQHLREHGFAGSTIIPRTVYLGLITRVFDDPVSVVIKGESGAGKSFGLHAGLQYVPNSAYQEVHGLSPKALVHAARHDLKHRFLIIQEAAGFAKEGWVFLRQLLTEGTIKYMTVAQTRDGHAGKDLEAVEGPMGVMMTTTADRLHAEDDTRLLSLYVDRSPEQIRRVIMMHAQEPPRKQSQGDLSQWHALYDYVCGGSTEVEIPYRRELLSKLPDSYPRVLRDIPKVLALIRAHTMLHQRTREHSGNIIKATMDDYSAVYELVSEALSFGLKASVPSHILEVVNAVCELHQMVQNPVGQAEVAEFLNRDQTVVSRNIATAIKEGFVENKNPGQGREHAYVPGKRGLPSRSVLPTPEELEAAVAKSSGRKPVRADDWGLIPPPF